MGVGWSRVGLIGLVGVGCGAPCAEGFERDGAGYCRATVPCAPGTARGDDLMCSETADARLDTGAAETTDTGEPAELLGDDGRSDEPSRLRVVWDGLAGYPAHGMVVMASVADDPEPVAAYCKIILQASVDIDAYLVAYTPGSDPCTQGGEEYIFDGGPVHLMMQVVVGQDGVPALCDERDLEVSGDTTVDYTGVTACGI